MARDKDAIGIKFGALGGGDVSGESYKQIKSDLDELCENLNKKGVPKVKLHVDKDDFTKQLDDLGKGGAPLPVKIDLSGLKGLKLTELSVAAKSIEKSAKASQEATEEKAKELTKEEKLLKQQEEHLKREKELEENKRKAIKQRYQTQLKTTAEEARRLREITSKYGIKQSNGLKLIRSTNTVVSRGITDVEQSYARDLTRLMRFDVSKMIKPEDAKILGEEIVGELTSGDLAKEIQNGVDWIYKNIDYTTDKAHTEYLRKKMAGEQYSGAISAYYDGLKEASSKNKEKSVSFVADLFVPNSDNVLSVELAERLNKLRSSVLKAASNQYLSKSARSNGANNSKGKEIQALLDSLIPRSDRENLELKLRAFEQVGGEKVGALGNLMSKVHRYSDIIALDSGTYDPNDRFTFKTNSSSNRDKNALSALEEYNRATERYRDLLKEIIELSNNQNFSDEDKKYLTNTLHTELSKTGKGLDAYWPYIGRGEDYTNPLGTEYGLTEAGRKFELRAGFDVAIDSLIKTQNKLSKSIKSGKIGEAVAARDQQEIDDLARSLYSEIEEALGTRDADDAFGRFHTYTHRFISGLNSVSLARQSSQSIMSAPPPEDLSSLSDADLAAMYQYVDQEMEARGGELVTEAQQVVEKKQEVEKVVSDIKSDTEKAADVVSQDSKKGTKRSGSGGSKTTSKAKTPKSKEAQSDAKKDQSLEDQAKDAVDQQQTVTELVLGVLSDAEKAADIIDGANNEDGGKKRSAKSSKISHAIDTELSISTLLAGESSIHNIEDQELEIWKLQHQLAEAEAQHEDELAEERARKNKELREKESREKRAQAAADAREMAEAEAEERAQFGGYNDTIKEYYSLRKDFDSAAAKSLAYQDASGIFFAKNSGRENTTSRLNEIYPAYKKIKDAISGANYDAVSLGENLGITKEHAQTLINAFQKGEHSIQKSADNIKQAALTLRNKEVDKAAKLLSDLDANAFLSKETAEAAQPLRDIFADAQSGELDLADSKTLQRVRELRMHLEVIANKNGDLHKNLTGWQKLVTTLGDKLKFGIAGFLSGKLLMYVRDIYNNVVKIDSAMGQLRIVTGATDAEMSRFLSNASSMAKELGSDITYVLNTIETFSRLGYNLADSSTLAKFTSILSNVAGVSSQQATTGMTSIIKGFGLDVSQTEHVSDVLVQVGQKYAVSAGELMEAYERSSAALAATGTSFEKSAGLIAAANAAVECCRVA